MWAAPQFPLTSLHFVQDSPALMTAPMIFLSLGAVALGYIGQDLFLAYGSTFYGNSIFTHPDHLRLLDASYASSALALIPLMFLTLMLMIYPFKDAGTTISSPLTPVIGSIPAANPAINTWRYSIVFDPFTMNHFNNINHW
jgi:hypothetical protein